MSGANFVDYVKIFCRLEKEPRFGPLPKGKICPQGRPDGGDGGTAAILSCAVTGTTGRYCTCVTNVISSRAWGAAPRLTVQENGRGVLIEVPLRYRGVRRAHGEHLCDITEDGQEVLLMKGAGTGQRILNRPQIRRRAMLSREPYEERWVTELKLLADVGLVGFPNAANHVALRCRQRSQNCQLSLYHA